MTGGWVSPHLRLGSWLVGLLAAYVALVIHEAGHLLAGRLVGFRFGLIAAGPFCIMRSGGRLSARWLPPALWGPFAVAYPVSPERLPTRFAWYTAGGPLASLAVALASMLCARLVPDPAGRGVAWLALLSACVFIATAQPFGSGMGLPSDGGRWSGLVRNDEAARAAVALVALESLDMVGTRPRDWDQGLVDLVAGVRRPPLHVLSAETARLRRALDANDLDVARARVAEIRAALPRVLRSFRGDAAAEVAFWFAHFVKDPAAGREFLRDAGGALTAPHRRLRAEAAVLARGGDPAGARRALERARAALDRGIVSASALDRELIDAVGKELEQT
jgi:hypothetical protein